MAHDAGSPAAGGLRIEMEGSVAVVHLERPAQRNTIDLASAQALTAFLEGATGDPGTRAIVLTGVGRDFCTGADVARPGAAGAAGAAGASSPPAQSALDYRYVTEPYRQLFKALWEVERPVVGAVNGTVAGAGWLLALLGDLVVAATGARWTHVFARRGMVPHAGDPYFLPRIIPFHRLNELALLSDPVTSEVLHGWGLVNRCVEADAVLPTAMELAARLAEGPTRTLGLTKRLYRRSLESDMATSFEDERNATALISTTADRREGMLSFVEGRPAHFTGQ